MATARWTEHFSRYEVHFDFVSEITGEIRKNCGYVFNADQNYNILPVDAPEGRLNLEKCLDGTYNVVRRNELYEWDYTHPATIKCSCNAIVTLHGFTNTCDRCDADYNMSGDRLAPRSQWGEETGETYSDIVGPYHDPESFGYPYDMEDYG